MRSVTHGSLVLFVAQVIANVGFFAAVLMLARALGPEGRGTIAFVIVSALVLARISEFGVADATLVFASRRPALRPELLANFLAWGAGSGVVLAGVGMAALAIFGPTGPAGIGMIEVVLVIVGAVAVTLTDAGDAFLLGSGRIPQRAVVLVLVPWTYAGLVGLMLVAGVLTVTSAASVWAISMVMGAGALTWLSYRVAGVRSPNVALLRESITFGTRAWLGSVASFLNMRLDQILLGVLATEAALGMYAVAVNGAEILLYFPAAVTAALIPALARAEPGARHEQALRGFRILGSTTVITVLLAAVTGPWLLAAVFGEGFQASVIPFLWLLPGAVGYATKTVFSSALLASSSPGLSSISSIVALATGVVLDLILIPQYGAAGAAFAASAAFLVGGLVAVVLYRRQHNFSWRRLVPQVADLAVLRQLNPSFSGALQAHLPTPTDLRLRGAGIVCISSIDWDFVWQAHQEIMSRLAAAGNRVIFIESTGGVRSVRAEDAGRVLARLRRVVTQILRGDRRPFANLTVLSPLVLPFPRSGLARRINQEILLPRFATKVRRIVGSDPFVYTFLPTANALRVIELVAGPSSPVVYHCLGDYRAISDDPERAVAMERAMVKRADLVLAQNPRLAAGFAPRSKVHVFRFGVDTATFDPDSTQPAAELAELPRPILGYIGALHRHVDLDLVRKLARAFPNGSMVLVGPSLVDLRQLRSEPNVHLLGSRRHDALPELVAAFDVGLIPYRRNLYTETVNPAKLFEYIAMGIPVVSTDLPEVVSLAFPHFALRVASDSASFVDAVRSTVEAGRAEAKQRRLLALEHDWGSVTAQIAELMANLRDGAPARAAS